MNIELNSTPLLPAPRNIPELPDYSHFPEDVPTLRKIYQYMVGDGALPGPELLHLEIGRSGEDVVGAWMFIVSREIMARYPL